MSNWMKVSAIVICLAVAGWVVSQISALRYRVGELEAASLMHSKAIGIAADRLNALDGRRSSLNSSSFNFLNSTGGTEFFEK